MAQAPVARAIRMLRKMRDPSNGAIMHVNARADVIGNHANQLSQPGLAHGPVQIDVAVLFGKIRDAHVGIAEYVAIAPTVAGEQQVARKRFASRIDNRLAAHAPAHPAR